MSTVVPRQGVFVAGMGEEFRQLHPMMQRRFGIATRGEIGCIGTGVMTRIDHHRLLGPVLALLGRRHILIRGAATGVPFVIENWCYRDCLGRDTVTFHRRFTMRGGVQTFDATMIHDARRRGIVDFIGYRQDIPVDLRAQTDGRGGLLLTSMQMRWAGRPLPRFLAATATVHEWYD